MGYIEVEHNEYPTKEMKEEFTDNLMVETYIADYEEIGLFHEFHDGELTYFGYEEENGE